MCIFKFPILSGLLLTLKKNAQILHKELEKNPHIRVGGDEIAPIKHIYLSDPCEIHEVATKKLEGIVNYVSQVHRM